MVKFGKNKFKALNKIAKSQNVTTTGVSNKILKRKQNAEKKVTFQKEVLLKEVTAGNALVKQVTAKEIILNELSKKPAKRKLVASEIEKPKLKPVQNKKKRQKTQINDTKLLLNLMKKKK